MAQGELAEFFAQGPRGESCVVAGVIVFDSHTLAGTVDGANGHAGQPAEIQSCVVADTFTAYRDIRGAIVQGTVTWPPASDDVATLTVSRTLTFSFANA